MAIFMHREPNVEAYQVGSDMEIPEWIEKVEKTFESPFDTTEYRVTFADGVHPLDQDKPLTYWAFIYEGQWIVKSDVGFPGYGYVMTVMDDEKFESLFEQVG